MLETFSGRNASQNEFELRSFIKFLQDNKVTRYLEIGARHGDTFHEIMHSLPLGSFGVAVDLPGGLWGTVKSVKSLEAACEELWNSGYSAEIVLGNSGAEDVYCKINNFGPFDAILIDGDHTYKGVYRDWNLYKDLAPIVAFHDIVGEGQKEKVSNREVEVPKLWAEIKNHFPNTVEFVDKDSKMGIGVCILR